MNIDNSKLKPSLIFLLIAAFFEGGAVMVVELAGAKMIGPYYGNTIYVWTAVLAITLGGLGSGYLIGGGKRFKNSNTNVYFSIYAISSVLVILMPIISKGILEATLEMEIRIGIFTSCLVFLFPPLFCFGLLSPIMVRIVNQYTQDAGKAAGKVYAVSTFGGILFTLLAGYILIPSLGLKMTVVTIAILTSSLPIIYFLSNKMTGKSLLFALTILILSGSHMNQFSNEKGRIAIVHRADGLNGQLLVAEDSKSNVRVLINNGISQTMYDYNRGKSAWNYIDHLYSCIAIKKEKKSVLIAGLGGGLLISELNKDGIQADVVDVDKRLTDVAEIFFNCKKQSYVFFEDDIRHHLNCTKKKFDIIVFDISAGESQPEFVYTMEGLNKAAGAMKKDGILLIHFPDNISLNNGHTMSGILAGIRLNGLQSAIFNMDQDKEKYAEYVIIATRNLSEITDNLPVFAANKQPVDRFLNWKLLDNGQPFFDEFADLEWSHLKTLAAKRLEGINLTTKILLEDGHFLL